MKAPADLNGPTNAEVKKLSAPIVCAPGQFDFAICHNLPPLAGRRNRLVWPALPSGGPAAEVRGPAAV